MVRPIRHVRQAAGRYTSFALVRRNTEMLFLVLLAMQIISLLRDKT